MHCRHCGCPTSRPTTSVLRKNLLARLLSWNITLLTSPSSLVRMEEVLPPELLQMVVSFLDLKSLTTLALVSRFWHNLITNMPCWHMDPFDDDEHGCGAARSPLWRVFMLGGTYGGLLEYSVSQNAWRKFPGLSFPSLEQEGKKPEDFVWNKLWRSMRSVLWEGKQYIMGGYSRFDPMCKQRCMVFDPEQRTVVSLQSLITPREGMFCVCAVC